MNRNYSRFAPPNPALVTRKQERLAGERQLIPPERDLHKGRHVLDERVVLAKSKLNLAILGDIDRIIGIRHAIQLDRHAWTIGSGRSNFNGSANSFSRTPQRASGGSALQAAPHEGSRGRPSSTTVRVADRPPVNPLLRLLHHVPIPPRRSVVPGILDPIRQAFLRGYIGKF